MSINKDRPRNDENDKIGHQGLENSIKMFKNAKENRNTMRIKCNV